MRDWCLVVDTVSSEAALSLGQTLEEEEEGADIDVDAGQARVWCFGDTEREVRALRRRVIRLEERGAAAPTLQLEPAIRVWNDEHNRYVDPGLFRRWLVRQRLAGKYAVDADGSGPAYAYRDSFMWGDGGGGGNGGGGNGH